MSGKMREKVEARLRKEQDADLRQATAGISAGELSELVRDGLRIMLGIRTKKQTEVKETIIRVPTAVAAAVSTQREEVTETKQRTVQGKGTSTVLRVNQMQIKNMLENPTPPGQDR